MKPKEIISLPIGTIVFAVLNTGTTGISKYQYIGIVTDHNDNKKKHVFLSEYLLSTVTIEVGNEDRSRRLEDLHFTKSEAEAWHNHLKNIESQNIN